MSKVLFISGQKEWVADLLQNTAPTGFDVSWIPIGAPDDEKVSLLQQAKYLVLHPARLSLAMMRRGTNLRLIQLLAAGFDQIDVQVAAERGVPVATNGGANALAAAEHTVGLLLALYRRVPACDRSVREGRWRKPITGSNTYEVAGKTVGIIGAGRIGCQVGRLLAGFGCSIIYHDIAKADELEILGARRASLLELLQDADIVSLHVPATPETLGIINQHSLQVMKKTAVLINTSRGTAVDEAALVNALKQQRIQGAALDVFVTEPLPAGNPFDALENVVLSPHTAGHTLEAWHRRIRFAWENIQRVEEGHAPGSLAQPARRTGKSQERGA